MLSVVEARNAIDDRDLLIFVGVIAALLVALVVVVSKMPNTNPLKRILTALCYRLAQMLIAPINGSRISGWRGVLLQNVI